MNKKLLVEIATGIGSYLALMAVVLGVVLIGELWLVVSPPIMLWFGSAFLLRKLRDSYRLRAKLRG